jgi:hypothetical protein
VFNDYKEGVTPTKARVGRVSRGSLWSHRLMKYLFGSDLGPSWYHKMMKRLLRSTLHPLVSGNTALISFTGRRTGREYTIPVSYVADDGTFVVMTKFKWWKNLRGGARAKLIIKGRELDGVAETVEDSEAIRAGMKEFLTRIPRDARFYEVDFDENCQPRAEDIATASNFTVLIKIRIREPESKES